MKNKILWILCFLAIVAGCYFAWSQNQIYQNIKIQLEIAQDLNKRAEERIRSADITIRTMQSRIDGLQGEVRKRAGQAIKEVCALDAAGIAAGLDRYSMGSPASWDDTP